MYKVKLKIVHALNTLDENFFYLKAHQSLGNGTRKEDRKWKRNRVLAVVSNVVHFKSMCLIISVGLHFSSETNIPNVSRQLVICDANESEFNIRRSVRQKRRQWSQFLNETVSFFAKSMLIFRPLSLAVVVYASKIERNVIDTIVFDRCKKEKFL